MTLDLLSLRPTPENIAEWEKYCEDATTKDLKLSLNIYIHMQEYEICGVIKREMEKRKKPRGPEG